jgi:hypothetical protein
MALAHRFQSMAVVRDQTLLVAGPAGSASRHVIATVCSGSHLTSPPPAVAPQDVSGGTLAYGLSYSTHTPILEVVEHLEPQFTALAGHIGMPTQVYADTVTQWATWAAVGAETGQAFTPNVADAVLSAALLAVGRSVSDEERATYLSALWQGVDLTLKTAGAGRMGVRA